MDLGGRGPSGSAQFQVGGQGPPALWGARPTSRRPRQLSGYLTTWALERAVGSPSTLNLRAHSEGGGPTEPQEASACGAAPSPPVTRSPSRSCWGPILFQRDPRNQQGRNSSQRLSACPAHRPALPAAGAAHGPAAGPAGSPLEASPPPLPGPSNRLVSPSLRTVSPAQRCRALLVSTYCVPGRLPRSDRNTARPSSPDKELWLRRRPGWGAVPPVRAEGPGDGTLRWPSSGCGKWGPH